MNSSLAGRVAPPFSSQYCASKFALEGLSDSLRRELKLHGVRVVLIEPGYIKSEISPKNIVIVNQNEALFNGPAYPEFVPYRKRLMEYELTAGQSPLLVAKLVDEAIRSPSPRVRYTVGGEAWLVSKIWWVPDSVIDWLAVRRVRPFFDSSTQ
eukprot:TRINITY_DN18418_c0_g1_i1.p3 TRINITY_DN18418_c0_g1~~TRINITY_DN18418_c0_g1_i1.p3  ORF type:complete len:153 (+),score=21.46 TRINITY_DN18418_c0_g1_i1:698-1156(+)